jgi:glycine hydroxymethyltransferase
LENLPTLIDRAVFPGLQGGPHMHQVMAIAVALKEAASPAFQQYSQQVLKNAKALAEGLMEHGCKLVTNGTDNHLMVIDTMRSWNKSGKEIQEALEDVGITLNKNAIPDDPLPPFQASGVRLGTPAATSRGLREEHMMKIAGWIAAVGKGVGQGAGKGASGNGYDPAKIRAEVREMCLAHPIPSGKVETY